MGCLHACQPIIQNKTTPSLPFLLHLLQTTTSVRKFYEIHGHMTVNGIIDEAYYASRLLTSPALLSFHYARSIFLQISSPTLFIFNTMIKRSADNKSKSLRAPLLLYRQILDAGLRPSGHTFLYVVTAQAQAQAQAQAAAAAAASPMFREGEQIHCHVLKMGFGVSQFVSSGLVKMYFACGSLDCARQVFDEMPQPELVLWTAIVRAYARADRPEEALELFREMRMTGLMPDSIAIATIVSASNQLGDLNVAKMLHGFVTKSGIEIDAFVGCGLLSMYGDSGSLDLALQVFDEMDVRNVVAWNAMIHQYAKRDNLELANQLFVKMPDRDVISWNTMISGYCRIGRWKEALALFHEMESSDVRPNGLTLSMVLSSCASLGALDTGMWVHAYVEKNTINSDASVGPALIDMYSKCGSIDKALQVFERIPRKDLFSWTSIICGLAMHGHATHALHLFSRMREVGLQPDNVTLVGVLSACAHGGLLDQGFRYFHSMEKEYNLTPKIEHYGCMVDLLGRMGHLREAHKLIMEMPMKPNTVMWGSLLFACRVHNNVELAEFVAERLLDLDPWDLWAKVMLSNLYAEAYRWDGVMRLRKEMKERGLKKMPGCSLIELYGTVHEFVVGDSMHPQHREIHSMLEKLQAQLTPT